MNNVQIICVNDFHAEISRTEATPGAAGLAAAIREYVRQNPDTLVLFGGDNYKGDPISEYTDGEPVSALMKRVSTKASVIGNHEFDFSVPMLCKWQQEGGYSFLAANLVDRETKEIPAFVKPYLLTECGGIKIAVLGLAMPETLDTNLHPPDIRKLEITDGTEAAEKWTKILLDADTSPEVPDVIIALTHFGFMYDPQGAPMGHEVYSLCRSKARIDGVFTAHWHQFMALRVAGIPVAQGGSRGQGFAVLTIQLSEDKQVLSVEPSYVNLMEQKNPLGQDAWLRQVVDHCCERAMKELGEVLGAADVPLCHRHPDTNEVPVEGSALGALALQAMQNHTQCKIALLYSGWLGQGILPGPITHYDLWQNVRFNGSMVTMKITGDVLLQNLQTGIRSLQGEHLSPLAAAGIQMIIDPERPLGKRLLAAFLDNGEPINSRTEYEIVIDSGIAEGLMGFDFSTGIERRYLEESVRDCLGGEIKRLKHVCIDKPDNVKLSWEERKDGSNP